MKEIIQQFSSSLPRFRLSGICVLTFQLGTFEQQLVLWEQRKLVTKAGVEAQPRAEVGVAGQTMPLGLGTAFEIESAS